MLLKGTDLIEQVNEENGNDKLGLFCVFSGQTQPLFLWVVRGNFDDFFEDEFAVGQGRVV